MSVPHTGLRGGEGEGLPYSSDLPSSNANLVQADTSFCVGALLQDQRRVVLCLCLMRAFQGMCLHAVTHEIHEDKVEFSWER